MKNKLLAILAKFRSSDLYLFDTIPENKMNNARAYYPIPYSEKVIALVDATVFGSAKNGLAIGLEGIYWKNDWTTETTKNFLSWEEIYNNLEVMQVKSNNLTLGLGCVVNLSASSFHSSHLKVLLEELAIAVFEEQTFSENGGHGSFYQAEVSNDVKEIEPQYKALLNGSVSIEQYGAYNFFLDIASINITETFILIFEDKKLSDKLVTIFRELFMINFGCLAEKFSEEKQFDVLLHSYALVSACAFIAYRPTYQKTEDVELAFSTANTVFIEEVVKACNKLVWTDEEIIFYQELFGDALLEAKKGCTIKDMHDILRAELKAIQIEAVHHRNREARELCSNLRDDGSIYAIINSLSELQKSTAFMTEYLNDNF